MAPRKRVVEVESWVQDAAAEIAAGTTRGAVQYLKDGTVDFKVVTPETGTFYTPVRTVFNGKPRTDYLFSVVILGHDKDEAMASVDDDGNKRVVYLKVPFSMFARLRDLAAKGWKVTATEASVFQLTKTGTGLNTKYTLDGVAGETYDSDGAVWPEIDIIGAAAKEVQKAADKANGSVPPNDEDQAPF